MSMEPAILEIGMGIDLHGQDYTEAAKRAVWDAVHRSSLMFLRLLGPGAAENMAVEATIGIPRPEAVRQQDVLAELTYGRWALEVVPGGLEIEGREGSGDKTIIANAAVVVKTEVS